MGFSDELTAPRAASNNRGRVAAALGLCALAACAWTGQQVALPHSGKGWLFTPASDALTPTPVDATALAGAHDANNPNRTHNTPEIVACVIVPATHHRRREPEPKLHSLMCV